MRKQIILLLIICLAVAANAQQYLPQDKPIFIPEHDFRIGIGAKPFEAANITFGDGYESLYVSNYFDTKTYYSGARYTSNSLFFEYIYQVNKWFGIGGSAVYLAYFNQYYDGKTDQYIGENMTEHFSLYPTVRFTWYRTPKFSAYSAFGVGQRLVFSRDRVNDVETLSTRSNISGQITLLGFTVGRNIYGFTDLLTLGSQGMLNVGLGYRFSVPQKTKKHEEK